MVHDCFGSFGGVDDYLARGLAVEQSPTQAFGNSGVSADRLPLAVWQFDLPGLIGADA